MGISIGESARSLSAVSLARSASGAVSEQTFPPRPRKSDTLEVGFGENTVSVPGVALRAVDKNFENARTVEVIREELRQRRLEQQSEQQRDAASASAERDDSTREAAETQRELVSFKPAPASEVRFFAGSEEPARPEAAVPEAERFDLFSNSARLNLLI